MGPRGEINRARANTEYFFILDLCDAIGQLGVFSESYTAAQTPK